MQEMKQFNVVDEAGNVYRIAEFHTVHSKVELGRGRSKIKTGFPISYKTTNGLPIEFIDKKMTIIDGENQIPVERM